MVQQVGAQATRRCHAHLPGDVRGKFQGYLLLKMIGKITNTEVYTSEGQGWGYRFTHNWNGGDASIGQEEEEAKEERRSLGGLAKYQRYATNVVLEHMHRCVCMQQRPTESVDTSLQADDIIFWKPHLQ